MPVWWLSGLNVVYQPMHCILCRIVGREIVFGIIYNYINVSSHLSQLFTKKNQMRYDANMHVEIYMHCMHLRTVITLNERNFKQLECNLCSEYYCQQWVLNGNVLKLERKGLQNAHGVYGNFKSVHLRWNLLFVWLVFHGKNNNFV